MRGRACVHIVPDQFQFMLALTSATSMPLLHRVGRDVGVLHFPPSAHLMLPVGQSGFPRVALRRQTWLWLSRASAARK